MHYIVYSIYTYYYNGAQSTDVIDTLIINSILYNGECNLVS